MTSSAKVVKAWRVREATAWSSMVSRMAVQTSPSLRRRHRPQVLQRLVADAAGRHVEDALEGRHVAVVAQRAQVGQRVLDLAPLVEAGAADELVAQPVAQAGLLDGSVTGRWCGT